ncbi:alpha/beta hydrolase [Virgibacillus necropolis]|uniref:Esterase n=1 Tax=Virgibacillus necropolis TaxID=163877 RepID=A0A221MF18_9BACI|nr:alpha/beta hydrolase family protein [Virgibacillus necropolis]ASN06247.1 esterase [Virgibacillus necropolis]
MALIQCDFSSEVLSKSVSMNVILPQKSFSNVDQKSKSKKYPTLFLLHGFSDNHTKWTRNTSLERYSEDFGIAVVMPALDNSYYTDMKDGNKYWTFLTEELPFVSRCLFPLSDKREDNFVAGNSMGGFGALKWGLNIPDQFAAIASLSGVTDMVFHLEKSRQESEENDKNKSLSLIFGNDGITQTSNDLLWKLEQLDNTSQIKPLLYQACGTEDFLYEHNMRFFHKCEQTGFNLTTNFGPGDHTWKYWDQRIQDVLEWLPISKS